MRHAIVGCAIVALLVATGVATGNDDAATERSALAEQELSREGHFSPAGSFPEPREGSAIMALADGRVALVGGYWWEDSEELASAVEIWDPATDESSLAGSLVEGRRWHTATLLPDGRVLVVGGASYGHPLKSAEIWDPVTGESVPTGPLAKVRRDHTATLLPDGRVLVVGGEGFGKQGYYSHAKAEIWDPTTGKFSPAGSLRQARKLHTATLLSDGRVLVVGGADWRGPSKPLRKVEVWDPTTGKFTRTGSLPESRLDHSTTLLSDGRVLVVGGIGDKTALVWDPGTGKLTTAGSLSKVLANHTATLLPNGRVLIVGGESMKPLPRSEVYAAALLWDPAISGFLPTAALAEPRADHVALPLDDGRVVIAGGHDWLYREVALAEVWESGEGMVVAAAQSPSREEAPPAPGQFSRAGSLAEARYAHTATLLSDGQVLVVGGDEFLGSLASAEVWDPATASFRPTGGLAEERGRHTATLLSDGRVLVIGGWTLDGFNEGYPASAEVWDPATDAFGPAGSLAQARSHHTSTLLPDGRVLVIGGEGFGITGEDILIGDINVASASLASAEIWDPAIASFGLTGSLVAARDSHTATLLPDGRVLVVGGEGADAQYLAAAEVWDPATEAFGPAGSLAAARGEHTATLLPDGRVLVIGGWSGDVWDFEEWDHTASAEVWDPATATFSSVDSLTVKRADHTASLLPDGRVLVIGGGGDWGPLDSTEYWDPATEAFGPAGSLAVARGLHTATLLPDGRVLVAGGVTEVDGRLEAEVWEAGPVVLFDARNSRSD